MTPADDFRKYYTSTMSVILVMITGNIALTKVR